MSYSWPGNVRQLENKIQQMVVMSIHPIIDVETVNLPLNGPNSKESEPGYFNVAKKKAIASFERTYLMQLLAEYKGDMVAAARRAGKSRTGLWNLVRKYGLSPRQFRH